MRDGAHLGATGYFSKRQRGKTPCIVALTPYVADRCHEYGVAFAAQGFTFVVVDVRGPRGWDHQAEYGCPAGSLSRRTPQHEAHLNSRAFALRFPQLHLRVPSNQARTSAAPGHCTRGSFDRLDIRTKKLQWWRCRIPGVQGAGQGGHGRTPSRCDASQRTPSPSGTPGLTSRGHDTNEGSQSPTARAFCQHTALGTGHFLGAVLFKSAYCTISALRISASVYNEMTNVEPLLKVLCA
jgi:hypothetical protein